MIHADMSPEMLRKREYDSATDMWSLGIVVYEMLFKRTPFHGQSQKETMQNIMEAKLRFPEREISNEAKLLLQQVNSRSKIIFSKMLNKDPVIRLKPHQIYIHPFVNRFIDLNTLDDEIYKDWI